MDETSSVDLVINSAQMRLGYLIIIKIDYYSDLSNNYFPKKTGLKVQITISDSPLRGSIEEFLSL